MTESEMWWKEMISRRSNRIEICSFEEWKSYRDSIAAVVDDPEVSPERRGLAKLWLDVTSR